MYQNDRPSFVPNVKISFMMKKADFMYPDWLSNNNAFPFQQTALSFVCPAPFRPGRKVVKPRFLYSSSSTATASFPGPDQLYGSDGMSRTAHSDDLGVSDISGYERDRQRLRDLEIGNKRPPSRSKRGSYALVEKGFDREEGQVLNNSLPAKPPPTFRSNGIRSSLVRGEQLLSQRNTASNSGQETDELIAMGTLWSPANNNNTNNATGGGSSGPTTRSSSTTTASSKSYQNTGTSNGSNGRKPISVNVNTMGRLNHSSNFSSTANGTLGKMSSNNKEVEPKYPDPLSGAPASFQQRLMELASLEAETIRWERTKKVKKKPKQDRDS